MCPHDGITHLPIAGEGEAFSVNPVLSSLKRLIRLCLDRLHTRYVRWTRPLTSSLMLGTIADLGSSKSVLTRGHPSTSTPDGYVTFLLVKDRSRFLKRKKKDDRSFVVVFESMAHVLCS